MYKTPHKELMRRFGFIQYETGRWGPTIQTLKLIEKDLTLIFISSHNSLYEQRKEVPVIFTIFIIAVGLQL